MDVQQAKQMALVQTANCRSHKAPEQIAVLDVALTGSREATR